MIVFAHGLEGSPGGTKAQLLRRLEPRLVCPDLRGVPLQGRYDAIDELTRGRRGLVLVGSSYGGLVAALLVQAHPERFAGVVLCAPALGWVEAPHTEPGSLMAPSGVEVDLIHGLQDTICPIEHSRAYAARSGPQVTLHEVEDDHPLRGSLALLEGLVLAHAAEG